MADDFVNVRLTKLGEELSCGQLQVHEGNHSFYFNAGETQRVTRVFDWERVLKTQHHHGHPLFEIVEPEQTNARPAKTADLQSSQGDARSGKGAKKSTTEVTA